MGTWDTVPLGSYGNDKRGPFCKKENRLYKKQRDTLVKSTPPRLCPHPVVISFLHLSLTPQITFPHLAGGFQFEGKAHFIVIHIHFKPLCTGKGRCHPCTGFLWLGLSVTQVHVLGTLSENLLWQLKINYFFFSFFLLVFVAFILYNQFQLE